MIILTPRSPVRNNPKGIFTYCLNLAGICWDLVDGSVGRTLGVPVEFAGIDAKYFFEEVGIVRDGLSS